MNRHIPSLLLAGLLSLTILAQAKDELVDFPVRPGAGFKALLTHEPDRPPLAVVVLLPGGLGDYRFAAEASGITMIKGERLPNRLRPLLLERGVVSYMLDAPADHPEMSDAFRESAAHLQDLGAVLDHASVRFAGVPIVLVGHSNGSISAAHAAANLKTVAATVLVSGRLVWFNYADKFIGKDGLSKFDWTRIQTPLLLLHHRKDDCFATPFSGSARLAQAEKRFELLEIDPPGSAARGKCSYDGTHNLSGQEQAVAQGLVAWLGRVLKK